MCAFLLAQSERSRERLLPVDEVACVVSSIFAQSIGFPSPFEVDLGAGFICMCNADCARVQSTNKSISQYS